MRNISYLGLCGAMALSLVANALGQQSDRNGPELAPPQIDTTAAVLAPASNALNKFGEQPALPAPDRSLLVNTSQSDQPTTNDAPRRGELGIWMGDAGGQGVRILRVTSGSAAQQAGLRVGDIILQVNGRDATSPHDTATLIRRVPIGEAGKLVILRNGNEQELQITMQPIRENARQIANDAPRQASFGPSDTTDSDLASRTKRLEQQINSLTQELATLRQELAQLRTAGPVQTSFNAEASPSKPPKPPQPGYDETPKAPAPAPTNQVAPTSGFGPPEEKPAPPAADASKPTAPPAPPAPSAENSSSNDLTDPSSTPQKSDDQPKAEEKPQSDDKGDADLFK